MNGRVLGEPAGYVKAGGLTCIAYEMWQDGVKLPELLLVAGQHRCTAETAQREIEAVVAKIGHPRDPKSWAEDVTESARRPFTYSPRRALGAAADALPKLIMHARRAGPAEHLHRFALVAPLSAFFGDEGTAGGWAVLVAAVAAFDGVSGEDVSAVMWPVVEAVYGPEDLTAPEPEDPPF